MSKVLVNKLARLF